MQLNDRDCLIKVKHLRRKKTEARKRLEEAEATLRTLSLPGDGCPGRDAAYFLGQWMAQRARQLDVIEETNKEKRDKISVLLTLEEGLHIALAQLETLQKKRRQARTQDMLGVNSQQTTAILAISVARAKMYEARVGVIEARLRRHRNTGTRQQQHMVKVCSNRAKDLRNKYNTYSRRVQKYHTNYRTRPRVELPDFETVEAMDVDDPFWNRGENEVEPGNEPEAERNRRGIDAYLARRGALEELRRIARESRHMMGWAIEYHRRIKSLKSALEQGITPFISESVVIDDYFNH
ncbi:uncharacterized protein MELLADRAFT_89318 [Melampsora larici-populina 98AG31]|uniref:Uncharacterized protein n=1 Tax=Melampsora larici-populina (strain 98AG31 / pathotype 3-4-7) TaxID=747676 RepID=F4R5Q6_MELLP|nr:uncharacterized protein MELLADRAFT_89318 [Melampsora larici-populina 98AG31]EGG12088.1 hypothetical protein MELLADRAFT_89318 [Melampsora larici-populina 98AG31]